MHITLHINIIDDDGDGDGSGEFIADMTGSSIDAPGPISGTMRFHRTSRMSHKHPLHFSPISSLVYGSNGDVEISAVMATAAVEEDLSNARLEVISEPNQW